MNLKKKISVMIFQIFSWTIRRFCWVLFFCINSIWILNPYWWFWKVQLTSYLCLLRFLISSQRPMFNVSNFLKGVSGFSWMKLSCCSTRKDSKHFLKNTSRKPDRRTILTLIWEFSIFKLDFSTFIFDVSSWNFLP